MSVGDRYLAERGVDLRERRDPTAATRNIRWAAQGQPQVQDWNAQRALQLGYLANIVAYRCITLIATTIAARRFRAGLVPPERPGDTAEHNPASRLAQLLGPTPGGPNVEWAARKLWAWSIAQKLSTGQYAWEVETSGPNGQGSVVALWPMVVTNLDTIPSTRGSRYFAGFRYGRPDEKVDLTRDQVHYGWEPAQTDVRQPFSPLQVARYALSIALANDQHQYAFLKNGAVPAYIIGVEAFDSGDEFEAFKRQWHSEYDGPSNSGKTHIIELEPNSADAKLSEALFVQTVGMSAKEGKLPEQYMTALQQIAMVLGVPWSKLDASGRTYDNASEEDRTFWESTLLGVAADFEDDVNMRLAPRLGGEVGWFDLSDVEALQPRRPMEAATAVEWVKEGGATWDEIRPLFGFQGPAPEQAQNNDPRTAKVGAPSLLLAKLMKINEAREDLGLDPLPGGDRLLTDDEIVAAKALGGGEEAARSILQRIETRAAAPAPPAAPETRATVDQEARRGAIWDATNSTILQMEGTWRRAFRRVFARQAKSVVSRLESQSRAKRWSGLAEARASGDDVRDASEGLFDRGHWQIETEEQVRTLFETLSTTAFARLSSHYGVSFDLEAEFAQLFITANSNRLAGEVTDTTYNAIKAAMAEGVGEGDSIPALADRIREVFADASKNRAVTIARTEVLSGHNAAFTLANNTLPMDVSAGTIWIATRDGRTRPSHAEADGQVAFAGQPFSVNGIGCAYPGDPNLPADECINCRCTVAGLTPAELDEAAATYAAAKAAEPIPIGRARMALAMVTRGTFEEARFRRALEVAA